MAYPHADIKHNMYIKLPPGIEANYGDDEEYALKLRKNIYGQKQFVFYRASTIFLCYVDDGIFIGPSHREIEKAISHLRIKGSNFEDKGNIKDYLGITIEMLQDAVPIPKHLKNKSTPSAVTKQVIRDKKAPLFKNRYHYRRVIGKMNYLKKCTMLTLHILLTFALGSVRIRGSLMLLLLSIWYATFVGLSSKE
eukprot:15358654-Ditylum_brightwellii.AAC.2